MEFTDTDGQPADITDNFTFAIDGVDYTLALGESTATFDVQPVCRSGCNHD
jgi:hypothetical protein